jgi:transposase
MDKKNVEQKLKEKYILLRPFLNEKTLRLSLAADAISLGHGGISLVARACGVSRTVLHQGIKELNKVTDDSAPPASKKSTRKPGGGRKYLHDKDKTLKEDLEKLVSPYTSGHPESPLCWTCKSVQKLTTELNDYGHKVSPRTVYRLLILLGYSLQANQKTREDISHPDRNAQFEHISRTVLEFQAKSQPVISVDTKKKELVGNYKNAGQEWRPKENPIEVNMHDFPDVKLGKIIPYGI